MACGRWGNVFANINSANPGSCKTEVAMYPLLLLVGDNTYDTKMCNIQTDGASGIFEGDNFRRLVSIKRLRTRKIGPTFP